MLKTIELLIRGSTIAMSAVVWMLLVPSAAYANWCDIAEFDRHQPESAVSDVNDAYSDIELEWASDVDPHGSGERAWHYIRNLHDRNVAVDWPKTGILVWFGKGLPHGEAQCQKHYDSRIGVFARDDDAPMLINAYPPEPAVAYTKRLIKDDEQTSNIDVEYEEASSSIETGFFEGDTAVSAGADVVFKYFIESKEVEVQISYFPSEFGVVISKNALGIDNDMIQNASEDGRFKIGALDSWLSPEGLPSRFEDFFGEEFFSVGGVGHHVIRFPIQEQRPTVSLFFLLDAEDQPIAGGQIYFEGIERFSSSRRG